MAKNTPNKRKSSSIANATPNKISKISDTPISKKIYKSPPSATKVIKKQVNGSKTSKSPNKNQKNGKQITPRGRKKSKQIEKVESDEESDDSMDELNGNNDSSHDTTDEEVNLSDEQVDEADSDDEAELADEADDSDEEIGSNEDEVNEADSDEEAEVAEEADDSDEEIGSNEEEVDEADSDEEAEVAEEADDSDEEVGSNEEQVDEADSDEEDDKKNDDAHEAKNNDQEPYFSVFVTGLNANVQMKNIFPSCNIDFVKLMKDKNGLFNGQAYVIFKDQKSMTKALEKDNTKFNNSVIKVEAKNLSEFCINVIGVDEHTNLYKLLDDCNIITTRRFTHPVTNEPSDHAYVFLKDKESLEKALAKKQIEDNGRKIWIHLPENLTLFVQGLKPNERINHIFLDCSIHAFKILRHPVTNKPTGKAHITFKDEDSVKKALEKNGTESGGFILRVERRKPWFEFRKRTEFTVFVNNLSSNTKLEEVFKDCKILYCTHLRNRTATFTGAAYVNLEDEEDLQKALLKNETEYDGHVITVTRKDCFVVVKNLNKDSKVEDIFKDCKIQLIRMKTNESGTRVFVHFNDKDSYEKALSKDKTEFEGKTIHVEACRSKEYKNSANARSYSNPIRNSLESGSKVAILKKKLLSELRAQAQQLEREIYGNSKPLYKKKP